jgi:hypothetical protein
MPVNFHRPLNSQNFSQMDSAEQIRASLLATAQADEFCVALKSASQEGRLGLWTKALTGCVVEACQKIGWRASARAHHCELLPVSRSEYLALDVMAFTEGEKRWLFPTAVMELENSPEQDKIAYSLWKVLCVRAEFRIVFCYRKNAEEAPSLIQHLRREVIDAMSLQGRVKLEGRTFVVVGSRNDAETFPYGFFKWWELNTDTGHFELF